MNYNNGRRSVRQAAARVEVLEARSYLNAGNIDGTFGNKGVVKGAYSLPEFKGYFGPSPGAVAGMADGRTVVAGSAATRVPMSGGSSEPDRSRIFLARYRADASLDTTFGRGGYTIVNIGTAQSPLQTEVRVAAVDSIGRIVVVGRNADDLFVARFTSVGQLDTTFGTGGKRIFAGLGLADGGWKASLKILPDARLVIFATSDRTRILTRLRGDGINDPKFNGGASFSFPSSLADVGFVDFAVAPDGRVALYGSRQVQSPDYSDGIAIGVTSSGKLDTLFGTSGVYTLDVGDDQEDFRSIQADSFGSFYINGTSVHFEASGSRRSDFILKLTSGKPNQSFAPDGRADVSRFGMTGVSFLLPDSAGVRVVGTTSSSTVVARIAAAGVLDPNYASSGKPYVQFTKSSVWDLNARSESAKNTFSYFTIDPVDYGQAWATSFKFSALKASNDTLATNSFARLPSAPSTIAVRADGRLFVDTPVLHDEEFRVVKSDGSLDKSFDRDGIAIDDFIQFRTGQAFDLLPVGDNSMALYAGTFRNINLLLNAVDYRILKADGTLSRSGLPGGDDMSMNFFSLLPHQNVSFSVSDTVGGSFGDVLFANGNVARFNARGVTGYDDSYVDTRMRFASPVRSTRAVVAQGEVRTYFVNDPEDTVTYVKKFDFVFKSRPDGSYDPTFGVNGILKNFSDPIVLVQDDGKIRYTSGGVLKRLNADGSKDNSFQSSTLVKDFDHFTIDERDRIIAWRQLKTGAAKGDIQVACLLPDGAPDASFGGGDGVIVVDTVFTALNGNVLVTPDNQIVVTNNQITGTKAEWFAARYQGSTTASLAADGALRVIGTAANDSININISGSQLLLSARGTTEVFSAAAVKKISANLFGGDDVISVNAGTRAAEIFGGAGNDTLIGGGGNDTLIGNAGADLLVGGAGVDLADYSMVSLNLVVTLDNQPNDGPAGEKDNVRDDIENITGGSGNDRITGSRFANVLSGGAGNDSLFGGDGNDTLTGGAGNDSISGETGNDLLLAKDSTRDTLLGGTGSDRAQADRAGAIVDSVSGVETFV